MIPALELAGPLIRGHLHPAGWRDKPEPPNVHYRKKKKKRTLAKSLRQRILINEKRGDEYDICGETESQVEFQDQVAEFGD